jgi:uncharacterized protein (TIGR00725 family)
MPKELIIIGVIGGNDVPEDIYQLAAEVGREIARRHAALVCGGMGGVMEAACRGAIEEKGLTIGILPNDCREANPYVQIPIISGIGYARNIAVVKSAKAIIAINGSYGTLTEIGYALQAGIPVIGLGTWSLSLGNTIDKSIILAKDPKDAVDKALAAIKNL